MTGRFLSCIADAAAKGGLSPELAEAARETYEEALAGVGAALAPEDADRAAAQAVLRKLKWEKIEAGRRTALSIRARRNVVEGIAGLKARRGYTGVQALGGGRGGVPGSWVQGGAPPPQGPGSRGAVFARSLELLVENKPGLAGGPFASIGGRYVARRGQMDALMAAVVEAFETKTGFDAPRRATLSNMVSEAFGEDTGDQAAKALASAWGEAAEYARKAFNAAGGAIDKLEGWGMPQARDPLVMRKVGKEAWIEAELPRLARERMIDRDTGQPFTEKRLRVVMGRAFDRIITGGMVDVKPGEGPGRGMLAKQRMEERFFVYRDAAAWKASFDQFGAGDPFAVMMHHLDEMARDIAQMDVLGPNPQHQFEWLAAAALREAGREEAAGVKGALDRAGTYIRTARNMLDHFTGAANTPERAWLADMGATTRSYMTGAALGSTIISELPSGPMFGLFARAFSGLSKTGDVSALLAHLASPEVRGHARRSGFIIEQATDGLVRGAQDSLRLNTLGASVDGAGMNVFARRLPGAVMRLQGLTALVQARKRVFRLEFMGKLADVRGRTLAELAAGDGEDRALAELLAARGFSEADWAKIRSAAVWEPKPGVVFLRPREIIEAAGEDLGLRIAEMIELQLRMAVPETTLWTRAKLLGQDRPGTFSGEFKRSWAMFRSFSMTAGHLYIEELAMQGARLSPGHPRLASAGLAAGLLAGLTVAGGMAIYLREIVKGNDPKPADDTRFWGAAAMQGGGLGILGDFFYAGQARNGKSSAMTSWGPTAAWASDTFDLTLGNAFQIAGDVGEGEDLGEAAAGARPGRDLSRYVAKYSPVSSLWWARAAWDRSVADQLQRILDPEAQEAFDRQTRRLERENDQGQWWEEGEALPGRAPAFGDVRTEE